MSDISHHNSNEENPERRKILNILFGSTIGLWALSMLYPVYKYLIPPHVAEALPAAVKAGKVDDLKPDSGRIIKFGSKPVILLRTPKPAVEIRAFSAICTHLGCIVQYRADLDHIWCACHNGHYDLHGINIKGPPPRPLPKYGVALKNGTIFVTRQVA